MESSVVRCGWVNSNPLYVAYHDEEWGVPLHDDPKLFEFLVLEGMQAGLSWETILNRRENYRQAFADFDPHKVSAFNESDTEQLMQNSGIIRNRLKIEAAAINARNFLAVQQEFGSFDRYIWSFVDGKTVVNAFAALSEIPTQTEISQKMSRDLKKRGFKFVGPTICYAFMQATGLVNDHLVSCFRYAELS